MMKDESKELIHLSLFIIFLLGFAGEDIGPPALVLYLGIGVSLDDLLHLEAGGFQIAGHFSRLEEGEVEENRLVPKFLDVERLLADVEGQEQSSTGPENALEFV